jgi:hypothetical protein
VGCGCVVLRLMKRNVCILWWVVGCLLGTGLQAAEWSVKSYSWPTGLLGDGLVVEGKGRVWLPEVPTEEEAESVKVFIQRSTLVFREYLKDLPDGSLVVFDRSRQTLAARTTEAGHDLIETMQAEMLSQVPRMLTFQVNLLEAPTADLGALLEEAVKSVDHTALLERLEGAGVEVVASASFETKSGQRAAIKMVTDVSHITEFAARADGSTEGSSRDVEPVGLTVELEPVIGYDGLTLDLNVAVKHTLQAGAPRMLPLGSLAGRRVQAGVQDFVAENWATAITLMAGQSQLLGVVPAQEAGKSRLCFITAAAPPLAMTVDARAEGWLKTHGDAVEKVPTEPKKVAPKLGLPAGMVMKKFRVPPDFLSMELMRDSAAMAPADPFGPAEAEPTFMVKMTAEAMLKAEGVPFPDGASATFNRETSTLTVVNLPDNVALVADLLGSVHRRRPAVIQLHLHVVEAAGAVVRKVGRESLGVTDHRAAWAALQAEVAAGRGRLVDLASIVTKSGQRSTAESGRSYAWVAANLKAQVPEAKGDKGSVAVTGLPVAELEATVERETVGLCWEVDPVLGADGETIDLNLSVRRYSLEPTERFEAPVAQEGVLSVDAPAVDFHPLELTTACTTHDGMWRMIGTWQPMGPDGKLNPEVMQAVFVRAVVVRIGE